MHNPTVIDSFSPGFKNIINAKDNQIKAHEKLNTIRNNIKVKVKSLIEQIENIKRETKLIIKPQAFKRNLSIEIEEIKAISSNYQIKEKKAW